MPVPFTEIGISPFPPNLKGRGPNKGKRSSLYLVLKPQSPRSDKDEALPARMDARWLFQPLLVALCRDGEATVRSFVAVEEVLEQLHARFDPDQQARPVEARDHPNSAAGGMEDSPTPPGSPSEI